MNFEIIKTDDKKYIKLKDITLGQGLSAVYRIEDKMILVLDPDGKDYQGNAYSNKVTLNEKEYGIVQEISSEAIMGLAELMKIIRTLGV